MFGFSESTFRNAVQARKAKTLDQLRNEMDLRYLDKKNYQIVNDKSSLDYAISCIHKVPLISVDTETTGLGIANLAPSNPAKDKIVGMSVSWERDQGIYIPFEHMMFRNMDKRYAFGVLRDILEHKPIVTHNGLFDGKVFYDEGILLNITQDTLLMEFNKDSTVSKGSKALKSLIKRKYGIDVIELSDIFENASDAGLFLYVEEELAKAYACGDSDHTLMYFMDTYQELLPGQLKPYSLDIRVQRELVRSEYNGKGINMELLAELNDVYRKDSLRLEKFIYDYVGAELARKNGRSVSGQYRFNIGSSQELGRVMFDLLQYPVPDELKGKKRISVDKNTLRALEKIKQSDNSDNTILDKMMPEDMKSSIEECNFDWVSKKDLILVRRDELDSTECKLVPLIKKYRKIEKLRSSFFAPLIANNFEGRYFSPISMTRAETARLIDFIQTLDKSLKKLVGPYDPDRQYLVDFDFAQIEYRTMAGESHTDELVEKLNDMEADYHREGGKLILNKPPEDITNDERSSLKSVNFGIPYGMSEHGILNNRYGIGLKESERKEKLEEIRQMLIKWNQGLWRIRDMLNEYRDKALIPVSDATLPWHLKGRKIGRISNAYGRTRLFYLDELSKQKRSSIRRQAGNYPIQSLAREIFCEAFCDFCDACKREGLMDIRVPDPSRASGYRFENKIVIMAYIHDECLMCVDRDVNYKFVYKLIYENCMKIIPGHPRYFCGINIIDNWYEGKDDTFEAPVGLVEEISKSNPVKILGPESFQVSPKAEALENIRKWVIKRIERELLSISPLVANDIYDLRVLVPNFKNYYVKPKIAAYIGLHEEVPKNAPPEEFTRISIESFALYMSKNPKFISVDGKAYTLERSGEYHPKMSCELFKIEKDSETMKYVEEFMGEEHVDDENEEETVDLEINEESLASLSEMYAQTSNFSTWTFK